MALWGSRFIFLPLVLLIVLAHAAEEAEGPGQNIGSRSDTTETTPGSGEESSRTIPTVPRDSSSDEGWPEHVAEYQPDRRPSREEEDDDAGPNDDDDDDDDDDNDEYEYEGEANGGGEEDEDEDEYVDELKAIAESHEAMSKGEVRNNASSMDGLLSLGPPVERTQHASQTFESDETTLVESSDEDVASNEAIIDEVFDKNQDEEVAELLKYKKEKNSNALADEGTKSKRVPTVKKELSTQKEILVASNETQVPKSLEPSEETLNRLNEEIADPPQRRDLQTKETEAAEKARQEGAQQERPAIDGKISADNRYTGVESTPEAGRKLDKRQQETFLKNLPSYLRTYLLAEQAAERGQGQKLEELGVREDALAKSLLKLLLNLAENPTVLQQLPKIENELEASKITREPEKRAFDTSLHSPITTSASVDDTEKGRKKPKKKKKKKKPKRTTTTTVTPKSFTATTAPSVPVTTETTWLTTQWRQVAERLLGYKHENPTKIHYALQQQARNGTGAKSFGIEKIHAPADKVKEPVEARPVHFGKVNTHLPAHEADSRPRTTAFDHPKDLNPARSQNHDTDAINQRPRYESMPEVSQGISHPDIQDDYQDDFPPGMDYGQPDYGGKNRFGMSYDYDRPWPNEDHSFPSSVPSNRWNWRRPVKENRKFWPQGQPWRTDDDFWTRDEQVDGNFNVPMDTSWQRREQMRNAWNSDRSKLPPWIHDDIMKARERPNVSWAKSKNLSENQETDQPKDKSKENPKLPKITMKAWNSLTSDPATWPYKLPGAKPWPKDANGKSYNPNADLVKKLGLDDERVWTKDSNEKPYRFPSDSSGKLNVNTQGMLQRKPDIRKPWMLPKEAKDWQNHRSEEDLGGNEDPSVWRGKYDNWPGKNVQREDSPKIQSVGAWVMPADRTNWRPYEIKPMDGDDELSARRQWSRLNIPDRSWFGNRNRESWSGREDDSWKGKYSDAWLSDTAWSARNGMSSWPPSGKSSSQSWIEKSNPWIPKSNPWLSGGNSWPSKSEEDVRRSKSPWLSSPKIDRWGSKSNDDLHRPSKSNDQAIWGGRSNEDILRSKSKGWLTSGDLWRSKPEDVHPGIKSSDPHSWTSKLNDEPSWSSNSDTWGSRSESVDWPAKAKDPNIWAKSNERPWGQQKSIEPNSYLSHRRMNEDWNSQYGKDASNNWPAASRWFAYHRVTALPIAKPGTNVDAAKSKNAFVAVSALSSPKYGQGSEWRKNEIEEVPFVVRNDHALRGRSEDAERLTSGSLARVDMRKRTVLAAADKENKTDALESQLEALGRSDGAPGNTTDSVERASSQPVDHLTPIIPTNSTALDKGHEDVASLKAEKAREERKKVEQETSPKKKHEESMP